MEKHICQVMLSNMHPTHIHVVHTHSMHTTTLPSPPSTVLCILFHGIPIAQEHISPPVPTLDYEVTLLHRQLRLCEWIPSSPQMYLKKEDAEQQKHHYSTQEKAVSSFLHSR